MITLKFNEFRDSQYDDNGEFHKLYILKDNEKILYIGISERNVYNRWFGGRSHIERNINGQWISGSNIGQYVLDHSPDSDNWTIELWTLEDGVSYLKEEFQKRRYRLDRLSIEDIEVVMIQKLHPLLNSLHNGLGKFTPHYSEQELQDIHHKIFG